MCLQSPTERKLNDFYHQPECGVTDELYLNMHLSMDYFRVLLLSVTFLTKLCVAELV